MTIKKNKKKGGADCSPDNVLYPSFHYDNLKFLGNNNSEFSPEFIEILLDIMDIFDNRHDFKPGRSVLTPIELKNTLNPYINRISERIPIEVINTEENRILMKLINIYKKCPISKETEPQVVDVIYNDILLSAKLPDKVYSIDDTSILTNNTVIFQHEADLIEACSYNIQIRYDNGKPYVYPHGGAENLLLKQIKQRIARDIGITTLNRIKFCIDVSSIGKWVFQDNKIDNSHIIESIFDDYDHFKRKPRPVSSLITNEDIQLCNGNLQLKTFKVIQTTLPEGSLQNDLQWMDKTNTILNPLIQLTQEGDTAGVNILSHAIISILRSKTPDGAIEAYELIKKIFYNGITDETVINNKFAERSFDFKRIMDLGKLAFTLYKNRQFNISNSSEYVVLVTHDRMLYALALCLRCPVIYVNISGEEISKLITPNIASPGNNAKDLQQQKVLSHPRKIEIRLPIKPDYNAIYIELINFIKNIRNTFSEESKSVELTPWQLEQIPDIGTTQEITPWQLEQIPDITYEGQTSPLTQLPTISGSTFKFYDTLANEILPINTTDDSSNRKIRINIYLKNIIKLLAKYINNSVYYINNILENYKIIKGELDDIISKSLSSEEDVKYKAENLKKAYNIIKAKYNIKYNYLNREQLEYERENIKRMVLSYNNLIINLNESFGSEEFTDIRQHINFQPNIHNRVVNEFRKNFKLKDYKELYHINLITIFNELFKNCDLRRSTLPKISQSPYINNLNNMIDYVKQFLSISGGGRELESKRRRLIFKNMNDSDQSQFAPPTPNPYEEQQQQKRDQKLKARIAAEEAIRLDQLTKTVFPIEHKTNNNTYAVHLLEHTIGKELKRIKYINDDYDKEKQMIEELKGNDIKYLMLYQAISYLDKAHYYAAILADMILNGDIATTKEDEYVKELCKKMEMNYKIYESMKTKVIPPIVLVSHKEKNIELMIAYCKKNIASDAKVSPMKLGGFKDKKRYTFYNAFLKEFKKSLKLN